MESKWGMWMVSDEYPNVAIEIDTMSLMFPLNLFNWMSLINRCYDQFYWVSRRMDHKTQVVDLILGVDTAFVVNLAAFDDHWKILRDPELKNLVTISLDKNNYIC